MSYQALYREWRPQTFADLVGQDHIRRILTNALAAGRVSHAYLFCGPRGTGKTSTAKILAKALNCVRGPAPEPCNECTACIRVTSGDFLDVLEIDGASNRGIDEIRDLREKVQLAPAEGRYKVYIIDEVHMLTTEAFNALLRTLEEPPAHVIFIFATTEAHKIPLTILSRCQRLDFHNIALPVIVGRLREVADKQGVGVEEETLSLLARKAEGSLRDALSLLDQCISLCAGSIDHEEVLAVLGMAAGEELEIIVTGLAQRDVMALLATINQLLDYGRDPRQLLRDLIGYFRNLLLLKVGAGGEGLLELTAPQREFLAGQAGAFSWEQLLSIIELLAKTEDEIRWDTQPRVSLEVMAIRLLQELEGAGEGKVFSGADIVEPAPQAPKLKEAPPVIKETPRAPIPKIGAVGNDAAPSKKEPTQKVSGPPGEAAPKAAEPPPLPRDLSLAVIKKRWAGVLAEIQEEVDVPGLTLIEKGEPVELKGDRLTLAFTHDVYKDMVREKYCKPVEAALKRVFGRKLRLHCALAPTEREDEKEGENNLVQGVIDFFGPQLVREKEGPPKL